MSEQERGVSLEKRSAPPREKINREELEVRLKTGKLENLDLRVMDLRGLNFAQTKCINVDIGEADLAEVNMKASVWEDCIFSAREPYYDEANEPVFPQTQLSETSLVGAHIVFTETLPDRAKRFAALATGEGWSLGEMGALHNCVLANANLRGLVLTNVDFGGQEQMVAQVDMSDLSGAILEGCGLQGLDLSHSIIRNIRIVRPFSLEGCTINEAQVEDFYNGLELTETSRLALQEATATYGKADALQKLCGINIF